MSFSIHNWMVKVGFEVDSMVLDGVFLPKINPILSQFHFMAI